MKKNERRVKNTSRFFWNNEVNRMEDSQQQETKNREREEEKKKRRDRKIRKFPRNSLKKDEIFFQT